MKFIKETILERSGSRQEFFHSLRLIGLPIEYKGNIPIGVNDNGKITRWSKLGITPDDFKHLDQKYQITKLQRRVEQIEHQREQEMKRKIEHKRQQLNLKP